MCLPVLVQPDSLPGLGADNQGLLYYPFLLYQPRKTAYLEEDEDEKQLVDHTNTQPKPPVSYNKITAMSGALFWGSKAPPSLRRVFITDNIFSGGTQVSFVEFSQGLNKFTHKASL